MKGAYVYVIFRPDGSPCYVGKGSGKRWMEDEVRATHNPHFAAILKKAKKEGIELPRIKVREGLTDAEAFEIERALIKAIGRRKNGGPLANMTDGGDGLLDPSPETRKKMSEKAELRMAHLSDEFIEHLSRAGKKGGAAGLGKKRGSNPKRNAAIGAAHRGRTLPPKHCAAISAARTGKKFGSYSPEHCQSISDGVSRYWERWRQGGIERKMRGKGRIKEMEIA